MRILSVVAAAVVVLLSAGTLPADIQDAAGAWNPSYRTRDGQTLTSTLTLKTERNQISGTLASPRGTVPIEEGTVNGASIEFAIVRVGFGDTIRIDYTGKISGDTMRLKMKAGARHPLDVTAKRASLGAGVAGPQGQGAKPLDIWVVDVEGGKAALFVTPTGQSVLIDSGWTGFDGRDPDRIMAAIADAGVKQIDYMLSTHYHVDHVGGLQELAKRIPIQHYVDHGPTVEGPLTSLREQVPGFWEAYGTLHSKAKRIVVRSGDRLPVSGVDWRIVTSAGDVLKTPLSGGGRANPACTSFTPRTDKSNLRDPDDAQSVGSVIGLGEFRVIDFGDLWWTKELEMMCPSNPIGEVDVFFASSHGADASNSLPLVHGLQPRVAVVQNGTRKGGAVEAIRTMRSSPGLEDVWQMHWSYNAGIELNSAGVYIANVDEPAAIASVLTAAAPGAGGGQGQRAGGSGSNPLPPHSPAFWLKISAQPDGSFTVTNSRNGFSKAYTRRAAARR